MTGSKTLTTPPEEKQNTSSAQPKLYDWQKEHAAKLLASLLEYGYAKDGSDTGTGKTIVSLTVAKTVGLVPFVICPKAVVPTWKEWIRKFGYEHVHVINYEKLKTGNTAYYDSKNGFKLDPKRTMVIFDEDHRCKGAKSQNAKMMIAAKRRGYHTLLLGATSCTNPIEMRALGYMLDLHDDRGWWNWCLKNGCKRGTFGGLKFMGYETVLKRIHKHIYGQGRGSRIKIKDLPPGSFPEGIISPEGYDVESVSEIDDIYSDLHARLEEIEKKKEADAMEHDSALVAQLRARQEVEIRKVPIFTELAKDSLESGNSVAIFVNFRETMEALLKRLAGEHEISLIHGSQGFGERERQIKNFQSDKSRIIICMVQAGGTGLSLHDLNGDYPRVSLISPSFSAIEFRQTLGRIHRAGAKTPAVQKIIFANDTVEMRVCRLVRSKLKNLDLINDDELNPIL